MRKTQRHEPHLHLALTLLSLCFLAFRAFDAVPRFSDGAIYLYMSSLLNQGILPYRDFFFAHPPLQLLFLSPVTLLFGQNFFLTHMSLQVLLVANAWVLFAVSRKFFPNRISLLAPLLYLFSYSIPATGAHWSGVHLALFMVLAAIFFISTIALFLPEPWPAQACLPAITRWCHYLECFSGPPSRIQRALLKQQVLLSSSCC
jgi:hypothetical protein